jgi:hypothetical protein
MKPPLYRLDVGPPGHFPLRNTRARTHTQTAAFFVNFLEFDVHEARLIAALDGDRLHAKSYPITPASPFPGFFLPVMRHGVTTPPDISL